MTHSVRSELNTVVAQTTQIVPAEQRHRFAAVPEDIPAIRVPHRTCYDKQKCGKSVFLQQRPGNFRKISVAVVERDKYRRLFERKPILPGGTPLLERHAANTGITEKPELRLECCGMNTVTSGTARRSFGNAVVHQDRK